MRVRDVDKAIFDAEIGRASHAAWAKPGAQKHLRTKKERARVGDAAFQRRLMKVYDHRLRVLRAYRAALVEEAGWRADGERKW